MEYGTIDSLQVDDLMERRPVRPPSDWETQSKERPATFEESRDADLSSVRVGLVPISQLVPPNGVSRGGSNV